MTSPNENYTSWHCGMKVVCVDDVKKPNRDPDGNLRAGQVYTIREMGIVPQWHPDAGEVVIKVVEIVRKDDRIGWSVHRFRPVQTRKTDISIFQRILSNPHKKIHKVKGERV